MARKNSQRSGRTSQQNIDRNGHEIYEKSDQITVLTDKRCDVKSQSREDVTYRVSYGLDKFTCECPYHTKGEGRRGVVQHPNFLASKSRIKKGDTFTNNKFIPRS